MKQDHVFVKINLLPPLHKLWTHVCMYDLDFR